MSGGVDSSVTALLLKEAGRDVIGVTMKLSEATAVDRASCCDAREAADAARVCAQLGIPHYVLDFRDQFNTLIIEDFVSEYLKGRTPNPCILCNLHLKFRLLLERGRQFGAGAIATGHYARVRVMEDGTGEVGLFRGADRHKEQTYFLYSITQELLRQVEFPLGDLTKTQVRELARAAGLRTSEKPESQEVCFIPDNNYKRFIRERLDNPTAWAGEIRDTAGKLLGRHGGIFNCTVGQRRGLGIALGERRYVVRIDPDSNIVVLGSDEELKCRGLILDSLTQVRRDIAPRPGEPLSAKIRYGTPPKACAVELTENGGAAVTFKEPVRAITPGQACVIYRGEEVIGGGVISAAI